MATTLYFREASAPATTHRNGPENNLRGTSTLWNWRLLDPARGAAATSNAGTSVTGPTAGVEIGNRFWISEPLAADVTISGTITFNLRMLEANMSANAGAQCVIERLDHLGAIISTVVNSEQGVELGTAEAAQNWTAAPTSTNFNKGDRIQVRVAANDAGGTMASGYAVSLFYDGPTAAASGDSYVTFTETFSFMTATPAGSILYLTEIAGPAVGAAVEKEMWSSRGDGVNSIVQNTAAGPTAPLQWTDTGGGTVVEWYSKRLGAFTLGERVLLNIRAIESNAAADAGMRADLAVTDNDGTNAVVWAAAGWHGTTVQAGELGTAEAALTWHLAADDLSVGAGQRLRLRIYLDDKAIANLVTGHTATLYYDGTSGGASGDSFITLTQTVTEYVATTFPYGEPARRLRRLRATI